MREHIHLSPSLMTMNLDHFREELSFLDQHVDSFHIDIMDGHFVPNLSLSPWFINEARKLTHREMSAHLMVEDPTFWTEELIRIRCEIICFPAENTNGIAFRLIDRIHDAGLKAGVVLNPETTIETILPYLHLLDKVTIMTVDPGFAGQRFLHSMLDKIRALRDMRAREGFTYVIEMDGSTNKAHWKAIHDAKPDIYIIGRSGLFSLAEDIADAWQKMKAEFEEATGEVFA